MRSTSGTYVLILRNQQSINTQIGNRGYLTILPGYYLYVGSAFGPGGVRSRVSRHCRKSKKKHWHIDYLRDFVSIEAIWCSYTPVRLEHRWASYLENMIHMTPVKGFGSSDCRCLAHLFYSPAAPKLDAFTRLAGSKVEVSLCPQPAKQIQIS